MCERGLFIMIKDSEKKRKEFFWSFGYEMWGGFNLCVEFCMIVIFFFLMIMSENYIVFKIMIKISIVMNFNNYIFLFFDGKMLMSELVGFIWIKMVCIGWFC